jgi:pantetheine-phosphate adenylyltransferase
MPTKRRIVIYPGSFDPVTNGHLDIVHRACRLFDHVVVAISTNSLKSPLFSTEERLDMLRLSLRPLIRKGKVSVDAFQGLLVHYVLKKGAVAVVRGLRAVSDFEYEFQMALMNRHQASQVETVFLMPDEKYTYLSSTLLKEVVRLGGQINRFIPPVLIPKIRRKLSPISQRSSIFPFP